MLADPFRYFRKFMDASWLPISIALEAKLARVRQAFVSLLVALYLVVMTASRIMFDLGLIERIGCLISHIFSKCSIQIAA